MKFLKLFFISIILFFILITSISFLVPSHVRISRAIDINASPVEVMPLISEPLRWKEWYPGADSMEVYFDMGVPKGYILAKDKRKFIAISERNLGIVIASIHDPKRRPVLSTWQLLTGGGITTVQWYLDFRLRWYPWEKLASLFYEKNYGLQLEKGLSDLKAAVESTARQ